MARQPDRTESLPSMPCPECGETMRLVGIERDANQPELHLLTFECPKGHLAVTTLPKAGSV